MESKRLAKIMKALSNENQRARFLENANAELISTEKRGQYLVARINKETLARVRQVLGGIVGEAR